MKIMKSFFVLVLFLSLLSCSKENVFDYPDLITGGYVGTESVKVKYSELGLNYSDTVYNSNVNFTISKDLNSQGVKFSEDNVFKFKAENITLKENAIVFTIPVQSLWDSGSEIEIQGFNCYSLKGVYYTGVYDILTNELNYGYKGFLIYKNGHSITVNVPFEVVRTATKN